MVIATVCIFCSLLGVPLPTATVLPNTVLTCLCQQANTSETKSGVHPEIRSFFDIDPRLRLSLSVNSNISANNNLFARMSRRSKRQLIIEDEQVKNSFCLVFAKDPEIRSLLEAIAILYGDDWEQVNERARSYRLVASGATTEFTFGPKRPTERLRMEYGMAMIAGIRSLPADQQNKILESGSVEGFPIAQLPPTVQGFVDKIVDTLNEEDVEQGERALTKAEVAGGKIRIEQRPALSDGTRRFFFTLVVNGESYGFRINDFATVQQRHREEEDRLVPSGKPLLRYRTAENVIRPEAAKDLKSLEKTVTFRGDQVRLSTVLAALYRQTHNPILTTKWLGSQVLASVDFKDMMLGEALNQLTKMQDGSEWNVGKYGFIVVTKPRNNSTPRK